MCEAIVHIGLNKTGSSTIQAWLRAHREVLLGQGILFEGFFKTPGKKLQHEHAMALIGAHLNGFLPEKKPMRFHLNLHDLDTQAQMFRAITARTHDSLAENNAHTFIISSEWLSAWLRSKDRIKAYHTWMSKYFENVHYLVYLRDQIDWYPSAYAQFIRTGGTKSFDGFLKTSKIRNYATIAQSWASIVGAQNFSVRLLERDFLTNGDLIEDFASVIGADITQPERVKDQNIGLSAGQLAAMRRTNKITSVLPERVRVKYQTRIFSYVTGNGNTRKMTPTDAQSRRIAERHASSNEQLRTQFFPERPILFKKSAAVLSATSPAGDPAHSTPKASHATAHTGHRRNN